MAVNYYYAKITPLESPRLEFANEGAPQNESPNLKNPISLSH